MKNLQRPVIDREPFRRAQSVIIFSRLMVTRTRVDEYESLSLQLERFASRRANRDLRSAASDSC